MEITTCVIHRAPPQYCSDSRTRGPIAKQIRAFPPKNSDTAEVDRSSRACPFTKCWGVLCSVSIVSAKIAALIVRCGTRSLVLSLWDDGAGHHAHSHFVVASYSSDLSQRWGICVATERFRDAIEQPHNCGWECRCRYRGLQFGGVCCRL